MANARALIDALKLQNTDVVADVGAGTGYFARRFARQVAHVYAEDLDPQALIFLRSEALSQSKFLCRLLSRATDWSQASVLGSRRESEEG